jgi:two-component system, NarL family, sensor kinase
MTAPRRHLQLQQPNAVETGDEPHTDTAAEGLRRRLMRMAFDVHDGPMQELIALSYGLRDLREKVADPAERGEQLTGEFDQLSERLVETEQMLRGMMRSLEQTATGETDLIAMVEEQVDAFRLRCPSVTVTVIPRGEVELHTDSQRIAVDRVLREALANVAKHSNAGNVTVYLQGLPDVLVLKIWDDGDGFDPEASKQSNARIGLRSMRERLELIGGKLTIDSRLGGPTTVIATIQKWRPADNGPASAFGMPTPA